MGNLFHQSLTQREDRNDLLLLNLLVILPQTLLFPDEVIQESDIKIQQKINSPNRKHRITHLNIEQLTPEKTYDREKQKLILSSVVRSSLQKPQSNKFKIAQSDMILKYNNKLIKEVQSPLELHQYLTDEPYQQKQQLYEIKLSELPLKGYNMPVSWLYIGHWYKNYPHGIGKIYHNTFIYEGYVNKGIPHLKGRVSTIEQIYEGDLEMNVRSGFGRLITKSGYFFEGFWKDNQRIGQGYQIHKNGHLFEGQYKNNFVFTGVLYSPKPEIKKRLNNIQNSIYLNVIRTQFKIKYEGYFKDNKFEGKGVCTWQDGRVFDGRWLQGKMNGFGVFIWPNGKRYQGNYVNNEKSGFGKFFSQPKTYQGYWQKGKPHGKGKIIKGDEIVYKLWLNGKMIKSDLQAQAFSDLVDYQEQEHQGSIGFY